MESERPQIAAWSFASCRASPPTGAPNGPRRLARGLRSSGDRRRGHPPAHAAPARAGGDARRHRRRAGANLGAPRASWRRPRWRGSTWPPEPRRGSPGEGEGPHVVAYDYGMKRNIVRMLVQTGCRVTVVPADTARLRCASWTPMASSSPTGPAIPRRCATPSEHPRARRIRTADVRYLPGASAHRPRLRGRHGEAALWASRR